MHRTTMAVAAVLALLLGLEIEARAEQSDRDVARVHFERGVALYEAGSYQDALDEFQAAYEAQPHPSVLVNIANCYSRTDRPVRALQAFERYLRERGARVSPEERADIEQVMAEQQRRVGEIRISVPELEGELRIDGLPVGTSPTTHTERVRAGDHRVELVPAAGGAPIVRRVAVAGGTTATVTISGSPTPAVEPVAPGVPPGPAPVEPPPTEPPPPTPSPEEPAPEGAAVLSITGSDGARIVLDGEGIGTVPYEGEVEPGEHALRITGGEGRDYVADLDFLPLERTEISIDLSAGGRPRWVPWVEWTLVGAAVAFLVPGIAVAGSSWGRFVDSEAMYDEIDAGRYSSQAELDLMWDRYYQMYDEYESSYRTGWGLTGVGIALAVGAITTFILDAAGVFASGPQADIEISPIDEEPLEASLLD